MVVASFNRKTCGIFWANKIVSANADTVEDSYGARAKTQENCKNKKRGKKEKLHMLI